MARLRASLPRSSIDHLVPANTSTNGSAPASATCDIAVASSRTVATPRGRPLIAQHLFTVSSARSPTPPT
jgi:hypothetical protein